MAHRLRRPMFLHSGKFRLLNGSHGSRPKYTRYHLGSRWQIDKSTNAPVLGDASSKARFHTHDLEFGGAHAHGTHLGNGAWSGMHETRWSMGEITHVGWCLPNGRFAGQDGRDAQAAQSSVRNGRKGVAEEPFGGDSLLGAGPKFLVHRAILGFVQCHLTSEPMYLELSM